MKYEDYIQIKIIQTLSKKNKLCQIIEKSLNVLVDFSICQRDQKCTRIIFNSNYYRRIYLKAIYQLQPFCCCLLTFFLNL